MEGSTGTPEEGLTFKTPRTLNAFHYLRPRAPLLPHRSTLNFVTTVVAPLILFAPTIIYTAGTGLRSPTSRLDGSGPVLHLPFSKGSLHVVGMAERALSLFAFRGATAGARDRLAGKLLRLGSGVVSPGTICPFCTQGHRSCPQTSEARMHTRCSSRSNLCG